MNEKITIIFPMAGEGQRFGNKFKPFLRIFNKTFIELAVQPFLKHKDKIKDIIFIVREDHCKQFDVINKLKELNLPIQHSVQAISPTNSVVETISTLYNGVTEIKNVIFCDCDHSINVDSFFNQIENNDSDCIIPGWNILPKDSNKWSIAVVDNNNFVKHIEEKKWPDFEGRHFGVIGCYYFKKLSLPSSDYKYISEIIKSMLNNKKVRLVLIEEAEFYGDPERLHNLYVSKKASTIFCDLDGTIIKHENIPDYTKSIEILDGSKEKIEEWRKDNIFIVLTTSRDEQFRLEMEKMLRSLNIRYEYLIMGLPPGPRYLINDKKPYSNIQMAKAFEVERNIGIKSIGHSFARIDVKDNMITKTIPLDSSKYKLNKLRLQYESMSVIRNIPECNSLIPFITDFNVNRYSIEYLQEYKGLHTLSIDKRNNILNVLFNKLIILYKDESPYVENWLNDFLADKIYSKRKIIKELGLSDKILELVSSIASDKYEYLSPLKFVTYYHGDLTYENILVKDEDIKFIDLDNDNMNGPMELDLGKLMQSVLTNYEYWDNDENMPYFNNEFDKIIKFYCDILQQSKEQVINKAYFYCVLHLIRMIPYQAEINIKRASKAIDWSEIILKKIIFKKIV